MDREAADRINETADHDPHSPTAQSGFDGRQNAADRNDKEANDWEDGD
ncbi:hypothetical protein I6A60_37580 [Frankia sp. AgB1.9]|nr:MULTISPECIES: hypothetical protein [unclassified Frankia]MBL7553511.1 hypothetical protein [Frankia sp. AgB1.9]